MEARRDVRLKDGLKLDARGLLPAVAQDALTGEVRMVAWMNPEALALTLSSGYAHFWSRSRGALWKKGETSGNALRVRAIYLDCDEDTVLLHVEPEGPTCHTGAPSCFYRRATGEGWTEARPLPTLSALSATVESRRDAPSVRSYTRTLLDGGAALVGAKLREEAEELARAVEGESPERVASEAADVVYHLLVALASRDVAWRDVLAVLAQREGTSGLDEKAARTGRQRE